MEDFKRLFIRSSFLCSLLGMAEANLLADYLEGVNLITPYIWIGLGLVVMILFVVVYLLYILHHVSTHGNYQPVETRESVLTRRIEQPVMDSFPSHPFQMQGGGPGSKRAECSICLQEFADGETVRTLPACKHIYHPGCIRDWLTTKDSRCPYCRYDYGSKDHMPSSAGV